MANVLGLDVVDVERHVGLVARVLGKELVALGGEEHDAVEVVRIRTDPVGDGPRLGLRQAFQRDAPADRGAYQLVRHHHQRFNCVTHCRAMSHEKIRITILAG